MERIEFKRHFQWFSSKYVLLKKINKKPAYLDVSEIKSNNLRMHNERKFIHVFVDMMSRDGEYNFFIASHFDGMS